MDSTSKIEDALKLLLEEGRTFILMVQSDSGNLTTIAITKETSSTL